MWCREKLKDMYTGFCKDYPIVTIEDPFDQDDWDATAAFTAEGVCQVRFKHLCCTEALHPVLYAECCHCAVSLSTGA